MINKQQIARQAFFGLSVAWIALLVKRLEFYQLRRVAWNHVKASRLADLRGVVKSHFIVHPLRR